MLPDYPVLKEKLNKLYLKRMRVIQHEYSFIFNQIPRSQRFEGNEPLEIIRETGKTDTNPIRQLSSEITINLNEIQDMSPIDIIKKIDEAAIDIAKQQSEMVLETVGKSAEKVGNVITTKKGKFTINTFFRMLQKVQIDFNEETKEPILPTLVAGENTFKIISKEFPQLETNPQYKKKFQRIINQKREEWYARESNRELAG